MKLQKEDERYILQLFLPFAKKEDIELGQKNGELILHIKNEKRCFLVPDI